MAIVAKQNFTVRSIAGIRIAPIGIARMGIAMRMAFGVTARATLVSSAVLSGRVGRIRQLALARTPVVIVHARRGAIRGAAHMQMRARVDARRIAHIVRTRAVAIGFGRTRPVFGPGGLGHGNLLCD
nr:hypothetical protein [Burkholderia sp. ABCPW 14]